MHRVSIQIRVIYACRTDKMVRTMCACRWRESGRPGDKAKALL